MFVATGADVSREDAKIDSVRSIQLFGTGWGRPFVATGADVGREEARSKQLFGTGQGPPADSSIETGRWEEKVRSLGLGLFTGGPFPVFSPTAGLFT